MKILFVNFTKFWGGGEHWTLRIMEELRNRNYQIVLFSKKGSKLADIAADKGFEVQRFTANKLSVIHPGDQSHYRRALKKEQADAVFLNSTFELKTIGMALIATGNNRKVLFNRGIPVPINPDPFKKYLFKNAVTDVVVNSDYVRKSLAMLLPYLQKEPEIVYHGIDNMHEAHATLDKKIVAVVGRLSFEKGVDLAIDAMRKVVEMDPEVELWIIGDGKENDALQKKVQMLALEQSIIFKGFSDNVDELLSQCRLLVLPSRWEGFGLVLLEAMRLGMPCVAFDHTAANEIIVHNTTGYLVSFLNIDLLAEKIIALTSDKNLALQMGNKGKELLEERFTIDKSIDDYEKILNAL